MGEGVGEYSGNWKGVGQFSGETPLLIESAVLDLRDPETVREVKAAMGAAPFMLRHVFGEGADPDFDERFFEDPVWGRLATKFGRLWLEGFKAARPDIPNVDSMFVTPRLFPASVGALMLLVVLGYRQPGVTPTVNFSSLPNLTAYFDETGGDPSKGSVLAPRFSAEDQEGGTGPVKASTLAAAGVGLLALVALGLVFGGRKRRR